jgi:dipeptidase E
MRLYLSSMDLGSCPERLVSLAGRGARATIIMNALDNFPDERRHFLSTGKRGLQHLGFIADELDLRTCFDAPGRLAQTLERSGLLWVNGGNTFLLRRAMVRSGFDSVVRGLLDRDQLVYGGFSAGVCAVAPSLHGIEFLDDPGALAPGYSPEPVWDGVRLIEYHVAVHYRTGDEEPIQKTVRYYREHAMPYVALRDGEVIVVDGGGTEMIGQR